MEYYTLGSEFEILVDNIDILNPNTQGRPTGSSSYNFNIFAPEYGLPQQLVQFWNLQNTQTSNGTWSNLYSKNDIEIKVSSILEGEEYNELEMGADIADLVQFQLTDNCQ